MNMRLKFDLVMEALEEFQIQKSLNLNLAKVKTTINGSVIVDSYFKTTNKNIYALGDVIDRLQLTPVAIAEAMVVVDNFLTKT